MLSNIAIKEEKGELRSIYDYITKSSFKIDNNLNQKISINILKNNTSVYVLFEKLLKEQFDKILCDLETFNPKTVSCLIRAKHITDWDYHSLLPDALEGFTLYIRPSEPIRITNGSYIVFDYEDFSCDSNFIIYYNMFRDEFFGEARIRNIPDMNYIFDSNKLSELKEKLAVHLVPRLKEIHQRANEAQT